MNSFLKNTKYYISYMSGYFKNYLVYSNNQYAIKWVLSKNRD